MNKKNLLKIVIIIFIFLLLLGCEKKLVSSTLPRGEFFPGDEVAASVRFSNITREKKTYWLSYRLTDKAGKTYEEPLRAVKLKPAEISKQENMIWTVPDDPMLATGYFDVALEVWDKKPSQRNAKKYISLKRENALEVFDIFDDFKELDSNKWLMKTHELGKGNVDRKNVSLRNGMLVIETPAGKYNGGEIRSSKKYVYGTYRAMIKTPNTKGSISALFLYQDVKKGNDEIDIEIFNDGSRKVEFTTWVKDKETNNFETTLPFDPTKDFNEYRFDFYPNSLSFYINGKLMKKWTSNLPSSPMKLMVNTWWPNWLKGPRPAVKTETHVDRIKH